MALNFPNGLSITSAEAVDTRLVLTKSEMLAAKKSRMPEVYFAVCLDDGKMYIYNSKNDPDPETGYYRAVNNAKVDTVDLVSKKDNNALESVDDGLFVGQNESITNDLIKNLFSTKE